MTTFKGRVWKFGDNINTDLMMPNTVRTLLEEEQKKYVFESIRPGWSKQVSQGDIIIGGKNFGTGSARPAAKLLRQLGVVAVVAETINGLFLRNCVNYGVVPLICADVSPAFDDGDVAEIRIEDAIISNVTKGGSRPVQRLPDQLVQLALAGGVKPLLKRDGFIK